MKIVDHQLDEATFRPAHQRGAPIVPELLVIHYTATLGALGVIQAFEAKTAKASAHLVVDLDGTVTQMVEFNRWAAHAGASTWRGKDGCNNFSIGIELVNPGPLYRTGDGYVETIRRRPWNGGVVHARHKNGGGFEHWAAYPAAQLDRLKEIAELLVETYSLKDIVGHDDVAPGRKIDPGPAFPLRDLKALLGDRQENGANVYRTTTVLNVRSGAGTQHGLVAGSPLPPNTFVELIDADGPWRLIRTPNAEIEGWCFGQYLAAG